MIIYGNNSHLYLDHSMPTTIHHKTVSHLLIMQHNYLLLPLIVFKYDITRLYNTHVDKQEQTLLNLLIQSFDTKLLCKERRHHDLSVDKQIDLVHLFLHKAYAMAKVPFLKHFMAEVHWHRPPWQKVGSETRMPLSWLRKKWADLVLDTLEEREKDINSTYLFIYSYSGRTLF